jgi:ATP-dependent Zn protease
MESLIAYHEAGHAVIACWLGGEVLSVTIDPDRDDGPRRDGDVSIRWHARGLSRRELCERELMAVLAGPVAEMVHAEVRLTVDSRPEWAVDWQIASEIAGTFVSVPRQREALLHELTRRMFHLVSSDECWQAIAEVADQLVAHETLDGEEVQECVERWMGRREA